MSKKSVSAKVVHDTKVCPPKYVRKARLFAVTQFDTAGKQIIHWSQTADDANKKFESLKSVV